MYKIYSKGEYREVHQSFNELHKRAIDKNFKIVSRLAGNMGVELHYCDGKQSVYLLICNDEERKLWWFEKIKY
jgi:hypothetical protein